jgi:hypothetical protein
VTITDEQLRTWRAAHAATTPGRWVQDPYDKAYVRCGWQTIGSANLNHHDAGLLAIAHEAMPALIDEVERLRAGLTKLRQVVAERNRAFPNGVPADIDNMGHTIDALIGDDSPLRSWAIEFRNGSFLQTLEAERGGPAATAMRFATKDAADAFMRKHEWISFNGGMALNVGVP